MEILPTFKIELKDIDVRYKRHVEQVKHKIDTILSVNSEHITYDNIVHPIDFILEQRNEFNELPHLISVRSDIEGLHEAYEKLIPQMVGLTQWLMQHEGIIKAFTSIKNSKEYASLTQEQQRTIDLNIQGFERAGAYLSDNDKTTFNDLSMRLSKLSHLYESNVTAAMQEYEYHVTDEQHLNGIEDSFVAQFKENAERKDLDGWIVTLDGPSYRAVMTSATYRPLRQVIHHAKKTLCSAGEHDNTTTITSILKLRHEMAVVSGFSNYAERSTSSKMASTPQNVIDFITDFVEPVSLKANEEYNLLSAYAKKCDNIDDFSAYDKLYYSKKYADEVYNVDEQEVKKYFQTEKVVVALFDVVNKLFGVTIKEENCDDKWHPDVKFFRMYDASNTHMASFYMDLYADTSRKSPGAWMNNSINRWYNEVAGYTQLPIAYICCNFSKNTNGPNTMTLDDVTTLFHEMGHGLHHMLTEITSIDISGISKVEWDCVELPSQLFENWVWDKETMQKMSCHVETGARLPDELYYNIYNSKNFLASHGVQFMMKLSMMDMLLHMGHDVTSIEDDVYDKIKMGHPNDAEWHFNLNTFTHIFNGGYAAGYYSYLWALAYAYDVFSEFEKEHIYSPDVAKRYLDSILSKGALRPSNENFKEFVGREMTTESLLKYEGII